MPEAHADDHAGLGEATLVHPVDEVAQHLLADLEVGDDPVLQGPDGLNVRRRAPDHALGLGPHGQRSAVLHIDGNHGRLVEDNATTTHVHQRVGRFSRSTAMSRPKSDRRFSAMNMRSPERCGTSAGGGSRRVCVLTAQATGRVGAPQPQPHELGFLDVRCAGSDAQRFGKEQRGSHGRWQDSWESGAVHQILGGLNAVVAPGSSRAARPAPGWCRHPSSCGPRRRSLRVLRPRG